MIETVGNWEVDWEDFEYRHSNKFFRCICLLCGDEYRRPKSSLNVAQKGCKSCCNKNRDDVLPGNEAAKRRAYRQHSERARKLEVEPLPIEVWEELVIRDCEYCGSQPSREVMSQSGRGESFFCNGVDRIDSNFGYEVWNVVPCCWVCNRAKGSMTDKEFLTWRERIARRFR